MPHTDAQIAGSELQLLTSASCDPVEMQETCLCVLSGTGQLHRGGRSREEFCQSNVSAQ